MRGCLCAVGCVCVKFNVCAFQCVYSCSFSFVLISVRLFVKGSFVTRFDVGFVACPTFVICVSVFGPAWFHVCVTLIGSCVHACLLVLCRCYFCFSYCPVVHVCFYFVRI